MINTDLAQAPYQIRGIPLYGFVSVDECVDFLLSAKQIRSGMLIAINPEKILTAEQNPALKTMLLEAEYNYSDGIGVVRSLRKKYPQQRFNRVAGADLWEKLMQRAGVLQHPVFLVGGKPDVLEETVIKLKSSWQVPIIDAQDGYFGDEQAETIIERISQSEAKIVTVAMGSPQQELFIQRCRERNPDKLYMGVGGTYDVYTGRVKRAPQSWQRLGLEWLYRLICQPSRLARQIRLLRYQRYHWRGEL